MNNSIIELRAFDCVKLDDNQFIASFYSDSGEKYQLNIHEKVLDSTIIRINPYYHIIQDFGGYFRISVKQQFIGNKKPDILELLQIEKYPTKNKGEVIVFKDLNTQEVFKKIEKNNERSLNSIRLINLSKEKLVIIREPHIYNSNYIIENWIHPFGKN